MSVIHVIEGIWIVLWLLILLLATRDLLDSSEDRRVARHMDDRSIIQQSTRIMELYAAMVVMAFLSLFLGILAIITPYVDIFHTPVFRFMTSVLFILGALLIFTFKFLALLNRYRLMRTSDESIWHWFILSIIGSKQERDKVRGKAIPSRDDFTRSDHDG